MGYLFVSYSRWDRTENSLTDRLLNDLRTAGVNLWLVPDDLPPGVDWNEEKWDGLANADGILYLFTRPLIRTPQIQKEISRAEMHGLSIYPVLLDERFSFDFDNAMLDIQVQVEPVSVVEDYGAGLIALLNKLPESVKQKAIRSFEQVESRPKSKGYVFISYAEEDSAFVERLRLFLAEKGYGYWDYQSSDRNFHTQLFLELEDVIQNAAATLSVLSPDWKKSIWAAKEYLFSEEVGTPVFLLKAREMGASLVIAGVPYIDFVRDEAAGFARLDRELRRKGLI